MSNKARKAPAPARGRGRPASPDAAHRRIAEDLRKRMRGGEFPPGAVLPSWRALAKHYGVGVRAVQLACEALKRDKLLAPTPAGRLAARDWDSPGTALDQTVLLVMTTSPALVMKGSLFAQLHHGIVLGVAELKAPLLLVYDDRLREKMPAELFDRPLKGAVLLGKVSTAALRDYEKLRVPVAVADHPGKPFKLHAAGADNAGAVAQLVERLQALGHKRIAFLRRMHTRGVHEVEPDSRARQEAYEALLGGAKGASVYSVFSRDDASAPAFRALLAARPRYTAAIASDVGIAGLLRQAAAERSLQVPKDLSVATFAADGDANNFTSLRFDFAEIGRRAARLLELPKTPPQHVKVPGAWFEGCTIGPASV
ncbi:MAG: substrate-binding domain-containing protein [Planctomycetes bacterium]|nr:substrate-binding domain-containing protein [Planctomycetota bacterium]